ncbi:S41 family peptidase [Patescibacteria group bacterium]|nr:S41 family peptidase [Patescibacteria group bacterium]
MAVSTKKKIVFVVLGILLIGISFGAGFLVGELQVICPVCPPEEIDFSLFWEVWKVLEEKFFEPQKLDIQKMIEGAISGMIKSLEDPYTVFFNPEETKEFIEETKGIFEGIGAEIGIKKGQLLIIAPLEGTPAERAGLRSGDKILKIDDAITTNLTTEEAVSLIRGAKGTEVILTISRETWEESKEIKIVRATIKIPSLKWELTEQDIAYLKIYQFFEKTDDDFRKLAIEILASPSKKIILDLRNNPGGYLEVAQEISGWFLERGDVVAIEDFGLGKEQKIYKVQGNEKFLDYPMVILINQGSASASEILAGALRDNRKILIIGETSFGKGCIQELDELRGGSSLKITVAKWLTPKGELITDKGLEPDIKVEMTEEDYEEDRDPQLEEAIKIIEKL